MTGGVLLMVVPWVLFAGAVATIGVLVARRKPNRRRGGGPGGGGQRGGHRESSHRRTGADDRPSPGSHPSPASERD